MGAAPLVHPLKPPHPSILTQQPLNTEQLWKQHVPLMSSVDVFSVTLSLCVSVYIYMILNGDLKAEVKYFLFEIWLFYSARVNNKIAPLAATTAGSDRICIFEKV